MLWCFETCLHVYLNFFMEGTSQTKITKNSKNFCYRYICMLGLILFRIAHIYFVRYSLIYCTNSSTCMTFYGRHLMVEVFVFYHIVSSVQDKFGNQQARIWTCHTPSAAPLPHSRRLCRVVAGIPCSRAADRVRARSLPPTLKLTETSFPPTEVSVIVIFIIYGKSPFDRDRFHAVPRSMHSMHWNPLSFTSWRWREVKRESFVNFGVLKRKTWEEY